MPGVSSTRSARSAGCSGRTRSLAASVVAKIDGGEDAADESPGRRPIVFIEVVGSGRQVDARVRRSCPASSMMMRVRLLSWRAG